MEKQEFKIGDLAKFYKKAKLEEKNIYRILNLNICGIDVIDKIKSNEIGYYGDLDINSKEFLELNDLVLYTNIFQENSLFVREESFMNSVTSKEKRVDETQIYNVQLLTDEEIKKVTSESFKNKRLIKNRN